MNTFYNAREYWKNIADKYVNADALGFAPVLHPGTPAWFNEIIDRLQNRAWCDALTTCAAPPGSEVLDVGCGTGRWLERYEKRRFRAVGVDATAGMLGRAATRSLSGPLVAAVAQHLPFREETFTLVSAITVIQHLPPDAQRESLREMARVLKSGGHLLLLDLISGNGPHIFPRSPSSWIGEASSAGLSLVEWHGQEFFVVDRAFMKCMRAFKHLVKPHSVPDLLVQTDGYAGDPKRSSISRSLYWTMRQLTCKISELLEPIARSVCPNEWATHGLFLFKK